MGICDHSLEGHVYPQYQLGILRKVQSLPQPVGYLWIIFDGASSGIEPRPLCPTLSVPHAVLNEDLESSFSNSEYIPVVPHKAVAEVSRIGNV